jgi:hypothetical protein
MYTRQAEQDKFILHILKEKYNGTFVEIGSNDPIEINNTYLLERTYDWRGIMIDMEAKYLPLYKTHRPKSHHLIADATTVDYARLFTEASMPAKIDYLQIDLEATNLSSLKALECLDKQVMDSYTFATVTFEHDVYFTRLGNTRERSREIFARRGYIRVFEDIHNQDPQYVYEDWYVHPDLVDMDYVRRLQAQNASVYVPNPITGKSINWADIQYV